MIDYLKMHPFVSAVQRKRIALVENGLIMDRPAHSIQRHSIGELRWNRLMRWRWGLIDQKLNTLELFSLLFKLNDCNTQHFHQSWT
jgi:hypothetical protein